MRRALVGLAVLVLGVAYAVAPPGQTLASWVDGEYAQGSFSAVTLPNVPGAIGCANHSGGLLPSYVTLSWTAPASLPAGAEYEVTITKGAAVATTFTSALSQDVTVSSLDLLGFLLGSSGPATVSVRTVYRTGATVLWNSPAYTTRTITYTAPVIGVLLGGFTC